MSAVTALPQPRVTVDEFLAWAMDKPNWYDPYGGVIYPMAPESAGHAKVKYAVQTELKRAIIAANKSFHMLPDGMTVRVATDTAHEPDALVYCSIEVDAAVVEITNPVIVVEVLSPSTRHIDAAAKVSGYFSRPSVHHYLIVDPNHRRPVLHLRRQDADTIFTRIVPAGAIALDPPGIEVDVSQFFS